MPSDVHPIIDFIWTVPPRLSLLTYPFCDGRAGSTVELFFVQNDGSNPADRIDHSPTPSSLRLIMSRAKLQTIGSAQGDLHEGGERNPCTTINCRVFAHHHQGNWFLVARRCNPDPVSSVYETGVWPNCFPVDIAEALPLRSNFVVVHLHFPNAIPNGPSYLDGRVSVTHSCCSPPGSRWAYHP